MLSLHDTQCALYTALTDGVASDALLAVIADDGLDPDTRLGIHRNNVAITLSETLAAVYPVVARLVGDDCFDALARGFIRANMPKSPSLLDFGGGMADHIGRSSLAGVLPYLADVARLEWAWHQAYHAADDEPLTPAALSGMAPEDLARLRLWPHPSAHLVASAYPVGRIWEANLRDEVEPVDLDAGPAHLLLLRLDTEVSVLVLDPAAFVFFLALDTGQALTNAAAAALRAAADFDITRTLADLLSAGAFRDFTLTTEELGL